MTQANKPNPPKKPNKPNPPNSQQKNNSNTSKEESESKTGKQLILDILEDEKKKIKYFQDYPIRDLVEHSEKFGGDLKRGGLDTNQIRKFLDAIIRIKVKISQEKEKQHELNPHKNNIEPEIFKKIESDIVLLKPKLAYAAERNSRAKDAAHDLNDVMSKSIDKVHSLEDFERLVQFIESIIAYHKAAK